ncbi:MAG: DUF362 domain-containing protein [Bacteroidales bacterium]|nr:DUF362 domain-containing protein [Bacteroidales bacterium]
MKNIRDLKSTWKERIFSFLRTQHVPSRVIFILLGVLSTAWFLIRVIPKPSRVYYPCMKATAPLAASFITYIIGITGITFFFRKAQQRIYQSRYLLAAMCLMLGLGAGAWTIISTNQTASATAVLQEPQTPNEPIGVAKGIFPGRVVWVHSPDATDKNCTNTYNDFWYMDGNTKQSEVNLMVVAGIQQLTGTSSESAAWDAIFRFYNNNHDKGDLGYTAGEKIAIKMNMNGIWGGDPAINTSPQVALAVLDQLVNVVGVAQSNISIGDPNCSLNDVTYNHLHDAFPNVVYWGWGEGRVLAEPSVDMVLISSDPGENHFEDALPQAYLDAAYLINLPVFKKHHRAGISISCKNHFGSIGAYTKSTSGAEHLHYSLPCPQASGEAVNGNYGAYRCFVDIMGHKDLGGKTILHLVDGLWSSVNWGHPPIKWRMAPFNGDWPNSLFLSLDPVAIESVCYDFLYEEFDEAHPTEGSPADEDKGPYPRFEGTDDYLHQAADPTNWPNGITYDPENDGLALSSMGTHEHWNNATNKQYTRNLKTGNGIELLYVTDLLNSIPEHQLTSSLLIYPNPVKTSATFQFNLEQNALVFLEIYSVDGKHIQTLSQGQLKAGIHEFKWSPQVRSGLYIGRLSVTTGNHNKNYIVKITVE